MLDNQLDSKRLAKNTIVLYIRTIVTMLISLYTSRVILNVLGITDYGIYNVVGGFVSLFAIVSQTMISATQRYLTFELGRKEKNKSSEVFSTALLIHVVLALILLVLFEVVGYWFINTNLNIDVSRMKAANWIFQFSVISFILNIIIAPYQASIIAHERMTIYAYVNILEAVLKLGCLYILSLLNIDYLIQYGFYIMLIGFIAFLINFTYCKCNFREIRFKWVNDKSLYKEMISFASYNFWGSASAILANQGINILLNMFYGVIANAARGISIQVASAVSKFVGDFTVSLNPQITKTYASGNIVHSISLVTKGSKIAFYLYLLFAIPIFVETPLILKLWLHDVPEYTVLFVRWTLCSSLLSTYANPITTLVFATGEIKKFSLWIGCIRFMVVPLVYVAFKCGLSINYAYIICFFTDLIMIFVRLILASRLTGILINIFINQVMLRTIIVMSICVALSILINQYLFYVENLFSLIKETIVICSITIITSFYVGFDKTERIFVTQLVKSKIKK